MIINDAATVIAPSASRRALRLESPSRDGRVAELNSRFVIQFDNRKSVTHHTMRSPAAKAAMTVLREDGNAFA
jgi:hypothetical protein